MPNDYTLKDKDMQVNINLNDFENIDNILKNKFCPKKKSALKLMNWALDDKLISDTTANGYKNPSDNKIYGGIKNCGKGLYFASDVERLQKFLYKAKFCRWRFCPLCAWRLSLKRAFISTVILKRLVKMGYRFIFLTLTIPNVEAFELGNSITNLSQAKSRLLRFKKYKNFIVGGICKSEVTHNYVTNTYHPHLHILLCVKSEYFKCVQLGSDGNRIKTYPNMVNYEIWQADWKKAVNNSRAEQIHIKAISNKDDNALIKSILELSKYTAKDSDMGRSKEVFNGFIKGLKGKRLFTPFGIVKELQNEFLENPHEFDDFFNSRKSVDWFWKVVSRWDYKKNVYNNFFEELTEEEKLEIQNKWLGKINEEELEEKD
jgi:plasmid rolling circle replication initiator protein Rep